MQSIVFFYITLQHNGLLNNNDNSNTMTIIILCSPHYCTPYSCYIHNLSVFRLEPTVFHLQVNSVVSNRFTFRSVIQQLTSVSTSV